MTSVKLSDILTPPHTCIFKKPPLLSSLALSAFPRYPPPPPPLGADVIYGSSIMLLLLLLLLLLQKLTDRKADACAMHSRARTYE